MKFTGDKVSLFEFYEASNWWICNGAHIIMKGYLKELHRNREFKANEILKDKLQETGALPEDSRERIIKSISLIQNRTRGPLFELMAEVILAKIYKFENYDRQAVFETPYGKRRIDLYIPDQKLAIEVKSGYARSRKFVRTQIKKDHYVLRNNPEVEKIVWICFRGATKPLISYLKKHDIEYYDLEYDLRNTEDFESDDRLE